MKNQITTYEWDIEVIDLETDDILDHHFSDKCPGVPTEADCKLVLVRDVWIPMTDEQLGRHQKIFGVPCPTDMDLHDRQWAYVEGGNLPVEFDGGARVPKRFFEELNKVS